MSRRVSVAAPGTDLATNSHDAGASASDAVAFGETPAERLRQTLPEPTFSRRQRDELALARRKHPDPVLSLHEGYAILFEEVDELWDLVRQRAKHRSRAAVLEELVQVAAMAQRVAEDLMFVQGLDEPTTYQRVERRAATMEANWIRVRDVCLEQQRELTNLTQDLRHAKEQAVIAEGRARSAARRTGKSRKGVRR